MGADSTGIFVTFVRPGGQEVKGELMHLRSRNVAEFRFPEVAAGHGRYHINLTTGEPSNGPLKGKLRVAPKELSTLRQRIDLMLKKVRCHFCHGPAHLRGDPNNPPPRLVTHQGIEVWCCGNCREPSLPFGA